MTEFIGAVIWLIVEIAFAIVIRLPQFFFHVVTRISDRTMRLLMRFRK